MTVRELIDVLLTFDPSARVFCEDLPVHRAVEGTAELVESKWGNRWVAGKGDNKIVVLD